MDSSGKTLKVKTPINKKLEKEGEEEDGFTTPKGAQFKIPPLLQCPPAPVRGGIQQKTTPRRLTSVNTSYVSHCWGQWLPTKEKEKELDIPLLNEKVSKHIEPDLAALRGEKGAAYDIIVLNAGIVDHLLGCEGAEDVTVAMERAKEAIDSGKALEAFELH
ncbi:unnamed protein product [Brassica oleracea var. botrytis]|uniref:Uncharacterized protein n=2 Tax=Brassica TaxID=3705 RepID=A0A3P6D6F9_BRAOL|nr:unnamed protein product [Brassica napus]CDY09458.1 BnaC02g20000D [Brassica napus]VDD22660.1 unnamed protein product [Brassica oleracea]